MWRYFNPNPTYRGGTGDCVIRAICKLTGKDWYTVYWDLCDLGALYGDWGNSNSVWREYLRDLGYAQRLIPNTCPACYTVKEFCRDNPRGAFLLATGGNGGNHAVTVINGDYFDSWDSGNEVPIFYFTIGG